VNLDRQITPGGSLRVILLSIAIDFYCTRKIMKNVFLAFTLLALVLAGCAGDTGMNSTQKGALGGGALGAGLGAIVGHETGHTGAGIAIGAASGLLGGGLIGNQMDKQDQASTSQEERMRRQQEEIDRQRRELDEMRRQQGSDTYSRDRGYDRYDNRNDNRGSAAPSQNSKDPYY